MKYEMSIAFIAFLGLATAAPMPVAAPRNVFSIPRAMLRGREVPQEHSHDRFLDGVRVNLALNNPNSISDPVFGLLGNAAAAAGAGTITNLDCLHQATADQAFTNAKAAGNVTGQADALMYAALERNTGKVGLASVTCNETAVNSEIAAVQQHQDPASTGAAAGNKAVVLALAKQLASIGADPQEALLSGTFAAGDLADNTGKGNTCDTVDDPDGGCIFSQNLLIDDATAAEISAAVSGVAVASGGSVASVVASSSLSFATASSTGRASDSAASDCSVTFVTATADAGNVATSSAAVSSAVATSTASSLSASTSSLDFGSCSDPAVLFENGLDGRTQAAFIAANQQDFNHGSALNIGVIASFICGQLSTSCKASDATNTACTAAEAAASAAGGTTQAAADAFNSVLGVSSSSSTTSTSSSASSVSSVASSAAAATFAAASSTASTASTTSSNVQTFTGTLGGAPPAVIQSTGDRPFSVNGDTFVGEGAALQRSCSIQNNACSNAVNSGQLAGTTVGDCGAQETACNAATAA